MPRSNARPPRLRQLTLPWVLLLLMLAPTASVVVSWNATVHSGGSSGSGLGSGQTVAPSVAGSPRADPARVPADELPTAAISYAVLFVESGLSSGARWSVTLAGTTSSSANGTITFYEPNGTFDFSVEQISGLTVNPSSGAVDVKGFAQKIDITFSRPTGFLGLSGANGYYFILIVTSILVVGGVAAYALHRRRRLEDDLPPPDRRASR